MKKIIVCFATSLAAFASFGQGTTTVGMRNDFKQISGFGSRQSGFEAIQTYSSGNVKGSQFFDENWRTGAITTNDNITINIGYLFLFDKVNQELYLRPKDTNFVVLADKLQIKSFIINTDKSHLFEPVSNYDPAKKGDFVELLVNNIGYTLLKLTKTSFEKANPNDLEKVKAGNFDDAFIDHFEYLIYHENKLQKITLNEYSIRKAIKDKKQKVDDFFNWHSNDDINEQLLTTLINEVNS